MLPETLVVDNGRAFIGEDLKDVCGQLGINLEPNPKNKPWVRGKIERFFKTNNTGIIHGLPGTSFSNVIDSQMLDLFLVDEDTQEFVSERLTLLVEVDPASGKLIIVREESLTPEEGNEDSAK